MNQKYWWIIIVVLAIIVVGVWIWKLGSRAPSSESVETPVTPETAASTTVPELGADTTGDIREQLQGINPGSVTSEFETINQDLNSL